MRGVVCIAITWLLVLSGCLNPTESDVEPLIEEGPLRLCNGMEILCERSYDNVTFPETHNSFATHEDGIYYPASNHETGFQSQWDAGMRAFMLDTHYATQSNEDTDEVRFCHGDDDRGFSPCFYGEVSPGEWLDSLSQRMNESQNDTVTLLIENDVQADHLFEVINASIPSTNWYVHQLNSTWLTLSQLIDAETRLVIFWEQAANDAHPYFHDFGTHSWTTNYAEEETEDMNCEIYRGDGNQEVFHMNSWLRGPLGLSDPNRAAEANDVEFLVERVEECIELHGKRPTFIAVDWWQDGDVVEAARLANLMDTPAET